MPALIDAIILLVGAIATIVSLFTAKGRDGWGYFWKNRVPAGVDSIAHIFGVSTPSLKGVEQTIRQAIETAGGPLWEDMKPAFKDFAKNTVNSTAANLVLSGLSTPENAVERAATAFAEAFANGAASGATTALFESLIPEKLNTLNAVGPILATMAGFENIAGKVLDPLFDEAFGKSLVYHYRGAFKAELPDEADAVTWHSRGLLTDDQLRKIFTYSGLKPEYEDAYIRSAFKPVSPFIFIRALETGIVTEDQARRVFTFAGMRPADQAVMLDAAKIMALAPYQKTALAQVVAAYERGLISDTDLPDALAKFPLPDGAEEFIQIEAHYKKLIQLTEIYRKSVSEAYRYGQISDADYVPRLEAIGMAAADAEAHYALDSIAVRGKMAAKQEREQQAEQTRIMRQQVRVANSGYMSGVLDEPALAAALAAAGESADFIAADIAIMAARRVGNLVRLYNLLLPRDQAALVRAKISAINEQAVKKLIGFPETKQQLVNLGLSDAYAQALASKWAAQAEKTVVQP